MDFFNILLEDLRGQRDYLHELLGPELPCHRSEDPGADRLVLLVYDDYRVLVELYVGAVRTAHALGGTHHHGPYDLALLDLGVEDGLFDVGYDHVADVREGLVGGAYDLYAGDPLCPRVVRHPQ